MAEGKCKSCGASVVFAEHISTGKPMIFDRMPMKGGTGFMLGPTGAAYVKDAAENTRVYISHFATCPAAAKHRAPKD